MQQQIANYIHGKLLEILIVGVVTYIIFFKLLGFKLSALTFCCRWVVCISALYRGGIGDDSCCVSGHVPVWHFPNVLVFNCGLCGESTSRWKLVGTVFIL